MTQMLDVDRLVLGPLGTNVYIVSNRKTSEAVIIDPAAKPMEIMRCIQKYHFEPKAILLTHGHFDHLLAANELAHEYGIPVYASQKDEWMIKKPTFEGHDFSAYAVTRYTKIETSELDLIDMKWKVIQTPGHSPGSVCYYIEDEKILFSGDTLFRGSFGRTDFEGGSMADLVISICEKLFVLPDDITVYPGHEDETNLGIEKIYNEIKEINK